MNQPERRRRERTRWLLVGPLVALSLVVVGIVWLESAHPQVDVRSRAVAGVPPLFLDDVRTCTRQADDGVAEELSDAIRADVRIASAQVYACPAAFDGHEVAFAGEVVGELVRRAGGAWAQVNDDAYALEVGPLVGHRQRAGFNGGLSVWLPDGLHEQVETLGRHAVRGDVLLLRGTLLRTDPADGGGITLRAHELEVLAAGEAFETPFHVPQAIVAGVLVAIALATTLWARRVRER